MNKEMKKDVFSSIVWTGIFAVILGMARALPASVAPYPTLVAGAGLGLCLLQLLLSTLRYSKAVRQGSIGSAPPATATAVLKTERTRALIGGGLLVAYSVCFKLLGYLISTPLFLFGFMHLLAPSQDEKPRTRRDLLLEAAVAAVLTVVVYVLFELLLKVRFPKGILLG